MTAFIDRKLQERAAAFLELVHRFDNMPITLHTEEPEMTATSTDARVTANDNALLALVDAAIAWWQEDADRQESLDDMVDLGLGTLGAATAQEQRIGQRALLMGAYLYANPIPAFRAVTAHTLGWTAEESDAAAAAFLDNGDTSAVEAALAARNVETDTNATTQED